MSRLNHVEPKDPDEAKLYTMNWSGGLNTEATISTSMWTIPPGLTSAYDTIVTGALKTTIKLAGGVDGQDYELINVVTTSDGENLKQAGILRVRKADGPA